MIKPLHAHLRDHARARPDKPAFLWYGAPMTFAQWDAQSDAFAARLAELGVKKGEPVALFLGNCPQYAIAHMGIQKLGAIVCPCGPLFKEHELHYQLDDLGARVIVAAAPLLPLVEKVRAQTKIEHVFVVHYADLLPETPSIAVPPELLAMKADERVIPAGTEDFLAVCRPGAKAPACSASLDDVGLMTYTSGTTGLPKGAMLTLGNAVYKSAAASDLTGVTAEDVMLAIAPLYHIAGMVMGLNVTAYSGATTVLLSRFDPLATVQALERHRVTVWYSIAPMNVACMQVPGVADMDFTALRRNPVTSFGITFTEALARQWQSFAPNCLSYEAAYGLSETHTMDTFMPAGAIRWGTHGKPVPGNTVRILDPDTGEEKAPGEQGEIVVSGPGVFKGYWNKPEATAQTLRKGCVHTGDMGVIDAEGYLTFLGRFKEMIKVSGYPVFPEEVETILIKHPDVAQAAVIGVPDPHKGEVVRAFLVPKPGAALDPEALIAWARDNMSVYKAPKEVRVIAALPATGAGKVLRRMLKDLP